MAVMFKQEKFNIHTSFVDFIDQLRPSAALDFFQDLAATHAKEIGVGFDDVYALGYIWVVMYEQLEVVKRLPKVGEEILVKTWPKSRGKLEFEREYEICDLEDQTLIKGISNWVLLEKERHTLVKANNVNYIGENYPKTNYFEKQKRRLNLNDSIYPFVFSHKVTLSDLDHNMHMNNAKYLDIIHNMQNFDKYKTWKKFEIAFLHEAKLNEEIKVKHFQENGLDCYKGYVEEQPCFEAIAYWEE